MTVEEVAASMSGAKVFSTQSTVDATSVIYQIKLTEESIWLTTFNTPFGGFKFERLPVGLVWSAPVVFEIAITELFEDIEKCEVIVDDFILGGKNTENNDRTLKQVLKRTTENDSDLIGKYKSASLINLTSFNSALKRFLNIH